MKFFKFNFLKDDILLDSAPYLRHVFYPKGSLIFREGDRSSKFYIIGRGKISMRVKKVKKKFLDFLSSSPERNFHEKSLSLNNFHLHNLNNFSLNPTGNNNFITATATATTITFAQIFNSSEKNPEEKEITSSTSSPKRNSSLNFIFKKKMSSNMLRNFTGPNQPSDFRKSPLRRTYNNSNLSSKNSSPLTKLLIPPEEDEEEERMQYSSGDCFGEWAIIYNTPRSASAYVVEDSDLFFLDKQAFTDHMAKYVIKSDVERKTFIRSRIPTFNSIDKFDIYYKRIVPLSVERNKTIYFEGTIGQFIYLIFHGEFVLEKDFIIHKNSEDKKCENRRSLLRLEKGSFAGLEILYNSDSKYQYSMKSKAHDFNVLLRIDVESLDYNKEDIVEDLREIYYSQKKTLDDFLERHVALKEKHSVRYVSKEELHSKSILNLINNGEKTGSISARNISKNLGFNINNTVTSGFNNTNNITNSRNNLKYINNNAKNSTNNNDLGNNPSIIPLINTKFNNHENPSFNNTVYIPNTHRNNNTAKIPNINSTLKPSHTPNPSTLNKPAVHINYITAYSSFNSPKNNSKIKSRNVSSNINDNTLPTFNFSSTLMNMNMNINNLGNNNNFLGLNNLTNANTKTSTGNSTTPNSLLNAKVKVMTPFVQYFNKSLVVKDEGNKNKSTLNEDNKTSTAALLNSIKKIKSHMANPSSDLTDKKTSKKNKAYVPNKFISMCVKDWKFANINVEEGGNNKENINISSENEKRKVIHNKNKSSDFLFTTTNWNLPLVSLVKTKE
jgi:CRP-like cAMP-binding protein